MTSYLFGLALCLLVVCSSCSEAGWNETGSEYMPDMYHSIAYEANVRSDYALNHWNDESVVSIEALPAPNGLPVTGTVPRGWAGIALAPDQQAQADQFTALQGQTPGPSIAIPVNGHVPYYYGDTEEERLRATAELVDNPFPITEMGLEKGRDLYNIFCAICHGEKGNGVGWLVDEENAYAAYPAAPANLLLDEYANASNGRYYHALMYGKNVMGAYADKMSYKERWDVIHWVRALQAKDKGLLYTATENTYNPAFGTPEGIAPILAQLADEDETTQVGGVNGLEPTTRTDDQYQPGEAREQPLDNDSDGIERNDD